MPDWAGWAGLGGTVVFGVLTVWQFVQYLIDRRVRDANKKHMLAVKHSLQALRGMCDDTAEVTAAERRRLRELSLHLLGIEHHIDAFLETQGGPPERARDKRLRETLNRWVMSGNQIIQRIKDDPGVPGAPGYAKAPSPDVKEAAEKWVQGAREMVARERPDFAGRFDFVDDFQSMMWVHDGQRGHEFNNLIELVAARQKRLGELFEQG